VVPRVEHVALSVAEAEPAVRDCLALFTMGTWTALYAIVERVKDYAGEQLVNRWAGKKQLRLLDWTACSPAVLGIHSRHGRQKGAPPPAPMALDDAIELVQALLVEWIRWIESQFDNVS
jgi:hypothetical protein